MSVQQDSPLLDLPPELRNEIWDLALRDEDDSVPEYAIGPYIAETTPPLLQTCHSMRSEILPMYCAMTTFVFHDLSTIIDNGKDQVIRWLDNHKHLAKMIRHARLHVVIMAYDDAPIDLEEEIEVHIGGKITEEGEEEGLKRYINLGDSAAGIETKEGRWEPVEYWQWMEVVETVDKLGKEAVYEERRRFWLD